MRTRAIVYGADDRRDHFEVADAALRERVAEASVALIPTRYLASARGPELATGVPTWGDAEGLCSGERFADQPAAAFCSGILVDWDLVLTAGHCTRVLALDDFAAVLGYQAVAPGILDIHEVDVLRPVEIVGERRDLLGSEPRLDYAWLRLDRAATPPRRPAAVYRGPPPLVLGDPVTAVGTVGGTPVKVAAGAQVRDTRAGWRDYFVADTDTSHGGSGGAGFDRELALVGVLARGGTDLVPTAEGCQSTRTEDGAAAEEQYTYADRAVADLCTDPTRSTVCRADCDEPCRALEPAMDLGGCALGGVSTHRLSNVGALLLLFCCACVPAGWRRFAREPNRRGNPRKWRLPPTTAH